MGASGGSTGPKIALDRDATGGDGNWMERGERPAGDGRGVRGSPLGADPSTPASGPQGMARSAMAPVEWLGVKRRGRWRSPMGPAGRPTAVRWAGGLCMTREGLVGRQGSLPRVSGRRAR